MENVDLFIELLGYIAVVFLFLSFQSNNRKTILGLLVVAMLFLGAHQALLGAFAGAVANGLTIVRNITFRYKNDYQLLQHVGWPVVFSFLLLGSSVVFWQNWFSLLPALAVIASTIALWVNNTKQIRQLSLVGPLLWIPYALIIDSLPTLLIQLVIISSIVIAILRFDRKVE